MNTPRQQSSEPSAEKQEARHDAPQGEVLESQGEVHAYDTSAAGYAGIASVSFESVSSARDFAQMMVDTVRESLLVLGFDLHVRAANESFYQTFGVRPAETQGRLVYDLGNGQWDMPQLHRLLEEILPDNQVFNDYVVEHDFEGIGRRHMLLNARRLNHHQMILLAVEDVTERHQAAQAYRKSEARFRQMAETVPDIIFTTTPDGFVDYVSPRREEVTGQPPETALGTPMWPEFIHPDDRPLAVAAWEEALERRQPYEARYRLRLENGAYGWFIARARPIFDGGEDVVRWFGTMTDVEALTKAAEEIREMNVGLEKRVRSRTTELEQRNKELQNFAYIASHDLREPLRKIQTFAGMIRENAARKLGEEEHYFLERMGAAAARMDGLLSDLLAFSRIATHQRTFAPVHLGEVARDVLTDFEVAVRETGAMVEIAAEVTVEGDRAQLRQLLTNLVGNAFKYRREGVVLRVRIEAHLVDGAPEGSLASMQDARAGGGCRLVIEDNGIGFDERYRERIFEPLERLHGQGTYEGTGMGLAICQRIVHRHGGRITAESAPGAGSRFIVELPLRQEGEAVDAAPE